MYTRKAYRRQGLAKTLLDHVIEEARAYGWEPYRLRPLQWGSLLYADYGFEKSEKFMQIFFKNGRLLRKSSILHAVASQ